MKVDKQILQVKIQEAKNGSQTAFRYLLDAYWKYTYTFQLKKTNNEEDAEDITIQTFSKAFDKIHTFDDKYEFNTWLIAISKNVYIDFLRKKSPNINLRTSNETIEKELYSIKDEAPSPEDKLIAQQNLAALLRDIKQLKYKYQQIIQLRFFQELSYKEISKELNEPVNNIKVKLLRAKKLLAEVIMKNR